MNFTDKHLSAYLDGELPDAEVAELERALQDSAVLRETLARLQNVDAVLEGTLGGLTDEDVPAHIEAMIRDHGQAGPAPKVVSLEAWKKGVSGWMLPVSLAASLLLGMLIGAQLLAPASGAPAQALVAGQVSDDSALFAALEETPSGQTVDGIAPVLSFASVDGVCREVLASGQRALACREDGAWTVLVVTHEMPVSDPTGYQTASSQTSIVFDLLADQLMSGPPMSAAAEASRIANAWDDPGAPNE